LKGEGVKYSPNIVVLGFVYLDMRRNLLEFRDYAKPKFELVNARLELRNVPVPAPERVLESESYRLKSLDLSAMLHHRLIWTLGWGAKRMEEITTAILDEMLETIRAIGATPLFAYLPVREEIKSENVTAGEKYLLTYCRTKGISCVSLRSWVMAEIRRGANIKAEGHWPPQGHRIVAQGIKNYLLENRMISGRTERARQ
jgi:hypothetical protein